MKKYSSMFKKEAIDYSGKGWGWGDESGIDNQFGYSIEKALSSKYFKQNILRLIFKSIDRVNSKAMDSAVMSQRPVLYIQALEKVVKNRQSYNKIFKNFIDVVEDYDEAVSVLESWNKSI